MSETALSGCHMLGDILVCRTVDRSYAGHSKSLNFARKSVKMLEFDFLKHCAWTCDFQCHHPIAVTYWTRLCVSTVSWTCVHKLIKVLFWVNLHLLECPLKVLEFDFDIWARTICMDMAQAVDIIQLILLCSVRHDVLQPISVVCGWFACSKWEYTNEINYKE